MSAVRTLSAIGNLERRKVLTPRQGAAARRLESSHSLGVIGLKRDLPHGRRVPAGFMDARIAARDDYDQAREWLGGRIWPIVSAVVCEDRTVQEAAELHRMNPTAAATLLKLGLDLLGDHYRLRDS